MSKQQKIGFVVFVVIIAILCGIFLPSRLGLNSLSTTTNSTLFAAVPTDAPIILEFNSYEKLQTQLKSKTYSLELKDISIFQLLSKDFKLFDKLFYQSENNRQVIKEGQILCVPQIIEAKKMEVLYIAQHTELKVDLEAFKSKWLLTGNEYNNFTASGGAMIHEFKFSTFEEISICVENDLLLMARNSVAIERALLQLSDSQGNIERQRDFLKVRGKTGNNSDCSIYLNFNNLPVFLSHFVNPDYLKNIENLGDLGSWVGLDIKFGENSFDINGYFYPNKKNKFFKALKQENLTDSITIGQILPDNTAFAMNFNSDRFRDFIKKKGVKDKIFEDHFLVWMGESLTYAVTEPTKIGFEDNQFWIAEVKDYDLAVSSLKSLGRENGELGEVSYPPHQFKGFLIDNLFEPIFGEQFSPIINPYYTFINKKYVVFGNTTEALELWVDKLDFQQTLAQDVNYQQFREGLPEVANIYQYLNLANAYQIFATYLNKDMQETLASDFENYVKIKPIAIQLTPYEDLQVINIHATFDKKGKQPTSVVWRSELESNAAIPPQVVKNHDTEENEIFVQDTDFRAYLLDRNGKILWQKQLDGKILSKIHQVDFYKNKKLQYLFNTSTKIHLLDRNGNNVDTYPIKLAAQATNGVTVLDYDGRMDYRLFVACDDGNIYGLLKNGEPLNGWAPQADVGIIRQPLQHFFIDDLDYLVVLNENGIFYLFQRSGEMRIMPINLGVGDQIITSPFIFDNLSSGAKRLIVMDKKGKGYVTNLNGKKFNLSMKIGKNEDVKFCMADFVGDVRKDYALLDGQDLRVNYYDDAGNFQKIYKTRYPVKQDELFSLQLSDKEKAYIATISYQNNEIYLLTNEAKMIDDFPLAGSTRFEITDLFGDGKKILTVANENLVYAYRLSYVD